MARRFPPPWSIEGRTIAPDEAAGLYVHFDEVRSRRAHHARNPNLIVIVVLVIAAVVWWLYRGAGSAATHNP